MKLSITARTHRVFFLNEVINTFIQQGCIKLIKSDSKYIYNVTFIVLIAILLNVSTNIFYCFQN